MHENNVHKSVRGYKMIRIIKMGVQRDAKLDENRNMSALKIVQVVLKLSSFT